MKSIRNMPHFVSKHLSVFATLVAVVVIISAAALYAPKNTFTPHTAHASTNSITGMAWSDNIGWICFYDATNCRYSNVTVNNDNTLSGYAWNDNIGWINFGANGCPTPSQASMTNGALTGWAQAVANGGGWNGCIQLADTGTYAYGPILSGSDFTGWAWGSDVVGWISFNCNAGGPLTGPTQTQTFTTSTSWYPPAGVTSVTYLVVAGGGGGAGVYGGGGGGGGVLTGGPLAVTPGTPVTVTVGGGGAGGVNNGTSGSNSVVGSVIATGGGGGGRAGVAASSGGSGGGGGYYNGGSSPPGNANPAGQGNKGGTGSFTSVVGLGGGGGGAGGTGFPSSVAGSSPGYAGSTAGNGGVGISNSISGSAVVYAGGGGGGYDSSPHYPSSGGSGGGGNGLGNNQTGGAGTPNTGGGGGGSGNPGTGGAGGSGIVIIQYTPALSPNICATIPYKVSYSGPTTAPTCTIGASPPGITPNPSPTGYSSLLIPYSTSGNPSNAVIKDQNGNTVYSGTISSSGTITTTAPATAGNYTYTMTVTSPGLTPGTCTSPTLTTQVDVCTDINTPTLIQTSAPPPPCLSPVPSGQCVPSSGYTWNGTDTCVPINSTNLSLSGPTRVRSGSTATLTYSITNPQSCTITGTNGYNSGAITTTSGTVTTTGYPINANTLFTLSCTGASKQWSVGITPTYQEQ